MLAKSLANLPTYGGKIIKWNDLPFHRKLFYESEAERFIKAINNIMKGENCE